MSELPFLWISLALFLVGFACYSFNSVTWLVGSRGKATAWEKLRVDLMAFFPGKYRNEKQLRWFRTRLVVGNSCMLLAMLLFVLHYIAS